MVAFSTAAVGLLAQAGSAHATGTGGSSDPAVLAEALQERPLDAIANAVGAQGRGAFADVFGNVSLDTANHRVLVYATSLSAGQQMLSAAKAANPKIDLSLASLVVARYSQTLIDQRIDQLMTTSTIRRYSIVYAADSSDGSGIIVGSSNSSLEGASPTDAAWQLATKNALT